MTEIINCHKKMTETAKNRSLARIRFTKDNIENAIRVLQGKAIVEGTDEPTFLAKYRGFKLKKDKLFFEDREVLPPDEKENVIREAYDNEEVPKAMNNMFYWLKRRYVNITDREVRAFIRSQHDYQHKRPVRLPAKGRSFIHESRPFRILETDLMFLPEDEKWANDSQIIMTMVDRHTRYCFAGFLPSKEAKHTIKFLETVRKHILSLGHRMKGLHSDQGKEFKNDRVGTWCRHHKITQTFQEAYTPAVFIEKFNHTLRRQATRFQFKYDTKRIRDWLKVFVRRYNETRQVETRVSPSDAVKMSPEERKMLNARLREKGLKKVTPQRQPKLVAGDRVRITTLKREKTNTVGHVDTPKSWWSDRIYRVERVVARKGHPRYYIKGIAKFFYREALQKVYSYDPTSKKSYKDRPVLDSSYDKERAHREGKVIKNKTIADMLNKPSHSRQSSPPPPQPKAARRVKKKKPVTASTGRRGILSMMGAK